MIGDVPSSRRTISSRTKNARAMGAACSWRFLGGSDTIASTTIGRGEPPCCGRSCQCARCCFSLAAVGLIIGAPALAQRNDQQAVQAEEGIRAKWVQAVEKKDPAAIAALFTEDGTLLAANGAPPVSGRSEIEKAYAGLFKAGFDHVTLTVSQGEMLGEGAAWTQGDFAWTGRGQNGEVMERKGRWLAVIVRDGGDWKKRILATNLTQPPPPQPVASGSSSTK